MHPRATRFCKERVAMNHRTRAVWTSWRVFAAHRVPGLSSCRSTYCLAETSRRASRPMSGSSPMIKLVSRSTTSADCAIPPTERKHVTSQRLLQLARGLGTRRAPSFPEEQISEGRLVPGKYVADFSCDRMRQSVFQRRILLSIALLPAAIHGTATCA